MAEMHDLRTSLGAAPIQRDVVRVHGPEATEFLQGQLSQDVAALGVDESAPSLLLQPSGKVDAWLRVTRLADDDVLLDVDPGHGEGVVARLSRFKLRTKVEIEPSRWSGLAIRGPGAQDVEVPRGALGLATAWPRIAGVDVLSTGELALVGVPLVSAAILEVLRIECGVPSMDAEISEATIPAEAGAWLVDASVSFTKGCYTGQELVARIDSRGGNVPNPVRGLRCEGEQPPRDAAVVHDGAVVGRVTSSATSSVAGPIALAIIKRSVELGAPVEIEGRNGSIRAVVSELPLR